jgi:hypothetical protein
LAVLSNLSRDYRDSQEWLSYKSAQARLISPYGALRMNFHS